MKFTDERRLSPAARALRRRILDVLPAGGYQLDRLFQLFDIEVTDAVPTAAVTTGAAARLCINPGFVARYCATDAALFVLILHELLHVVLGHTRLFPRATWANNVAFDAVINAMIARAHPQPDYLELLTATNGWDTFPGRLLRPPPGWPQRPEPLPADATDAERSIHARLYSTGAADVTYHEIFALLESLRRERAGTDPLGKPLLLGGHASAGDTTDDHEPRLDPTLRAVLRATMDSWPAPLRTALRSGVGSAHDLALAAAESPDRALERALAEIFARAGFGRPGQLRQLRASIAVPTSMLSVLPQLGDRRAVARAQALGQSPLFWETSCTRTVRSRRPAPRAFVYLDVSGSMDAFLPALRAALARPVRAGVARLFAFSTEVHEIDVRTFGRSATRSTGGTEGNAVLLHLLALPPQQRPRAVVLVTDGAVGKPRADLVARLQELRIAVHVALSPAGHRQDLKPLATTIHELPVPGAPEPTATQPAATQPAATQPAATQPRRPA